MHAHHLTQKKDPTWKEIRAMMKDDPKWSDIAREVEQEHEPSTEEKIEFDGHKVFEEWRNAAN